MIIYLICILKKAQNPTEEQNYILPKIACAGFFALVSAGLFDLLAKISVSDGIRPHGISFYGGLIGAVSSLFLLCKFSKKESEFSIEQWFDLLTMPFVLFHIFGRIGCFLGGCCYGKYTERPIGIYFPDNPSQHIVHNGFKCYPTQLFEICLLILIMAILHFRKRKFQLYLAMYAAGRFIIEFFRGDSRGNFLLYLSPAQWISILILFSIVCVTVHRRKGRHI